MGLVQRQSIKYSIVNWAGVLIGVLSTLFVYPHALEEYGLMRFIIDTSTLVYPFVSLGMNSLIIRFFPRFEDKEKGHHGFLFLLVTWGLIGYVVVAVVALFFWKDILGFYAGRSPLFSEYLWLLFPVLFITLLNSIFHQYSIGFRRIVVPSLLIDFSQKIALPLLVVAYWQQWISLRIMLVGVVVYMLLVTVGFVWYIVTLGGWRWKPDFEFFNKKLFREMLDYAIFGIVGGAGYMVVSRLDTWLVGTFVSLKSNGIYSISMFIASVLEVPTRAIVGISIPLIAKHWHDQNTAEISVLYRQASINLLIAGLFLFGSFWVSVEPFFKIIVNGEMLEAGKWVILLLGIGKLVDMATGLNNYVLNYSKFYRYSYLQIALPAILSVSLGLWLVPKMGIMGAAITALCSTVLFNLISLMLNWYFFKMQPFSFGALKALAISVAAFAATWFLPMPGDPWLAVCLKSGTFAVLFGAAVLWLRLSPELNKMFDKLMKVESGLRKG